MFFFPTVRWPCFQILSSPMFGGENLEWLANSRKSGCFLPLTAGYLNMKRSNAMMIQRRTISTSCGIKESEPIPPSYPGSGDNGEEKIKMVLYCNSVSLVHFLLSWKTWEHGSYSVWSSFRGQAVPLGLLTLCEAFCIAAVVLCLQLQEGKNKRPHTISCLLFTFSSPLPRIRACAWPKCSHTHTRTHPWLNRSVGQFTNSGEDVGECKRTMTN